MEQAGLTALNPQEALARRSDGVGPRPADRGFQADGDPGPLPVAANADGLPGTDVAADVADAHRQAGIAPSD